MPLDKFEMIETGKRVGETDLFKHKMSMMISTSNDSTITWISFS